MSAWLAPGGSIIEIGSPGATRITTKTTTATPNSVIGHRQQADQEPSQQQHSEPARYRMTPKNLRLFGHMRRSENRGSTGCRLDGAGLPMSGKRAISERERRARSERCVADQAGVIKAGSSAPDLCCTTLTPLACTIGCAYWISGMT